MSAALPNSLNPDSFGRFHASLATLRFPVGASALLEWRHGLRSVQETFGQTDTGATRSPSVELPDTLSDRHREAVAGVLSAIHALHTHHLARSRAAEQELRLKSAALSGIRRRGVLLATALVTLVPAGPALTWALGHSAWMGGILSLLVVIGAFLATRRVRRLRQEQETVRRALANLLRHRTERVAWQEVGSRVVWLLGFQPPPGGVLVNPSDDAARADP